MTTIQDLTGEWFDVSIHNQIKDIDTLIHNLNTMLYRFKDDKEIKDRVKIQLDLAEIKHKEKIKENDDKIKDRDLAFLRELENAGTNQ